MLEILEEVLYYLGSEKQRHWSVIDQSLFLHNEKPGFLMMRSYNSCLYKHTSNILSPSEMECICLVTFLRTQMFYLNTNSSL